MKRRRSRNNTRRNTRRNPKRNNRPRRKRGFFSRIFSRAPKQILSGLTLLILGLLVFRFSYKIFVVWLNWGEGMAWSWLIGLIFILAGAYTIIAWWRNNVLNFNARVRLR